MAKWQELCELLMDKEFTPQKIVEKLGVKPYRLKQMLESKRLAERLELVEQIAAVRADHAILVAMEPAADRLAALAAKETETGRKACLDVLTQGQALRTERQSSRATSRLANWHNDFRKWERKEKRKAERQEAEANACPPDEWREAASAQANPPRYEEPAPPVQPAARGTAKAEAIAARKAQAPPRRMSNAKRRELAGLPPEKTKRGPVTVAPAPGYRQSADFIPRPGGRVVQHIIGGKVFLGST